jgi:Subtilase family/FG-GAP-like repeat/Peptidase inhibitor I9
VKAKYFVKKFSVWFMLLVLLAACGQPQSSDEALEQEDLAPLYGMDDPNKIPGAYIVVMKEGSQDQASLSASSLTSLTTLEGLSLKSQYEVEGFQGFAAQMTEPTLAQVRSNSNVAYVETDSVITLEKSNAAEADTISPLAFAASWGQDRVDQHDLPLNDTFKPTKTGRGVNVYVIDTGIRRTHTEFGTRVATGATFINDGRGTDDCDGHGTHVAGTIGGRTVGIATEVTLIPVRIFDCDGASTASSAIDGINWVTNNVQYPAVVNASFGTSVPKQSLDDAVKASIARTISYVVAAMNDDVDACNVSPARVTEAITVGATINTDARWVGSNWGNCVDVFAPGVDIRSAFNFSDDAYFTNSGTSMAAPHVTGAVAAMLTLDPLYGIVGSTPYAVQRRIKACSTKFVVTDAKSINNHLLHLCNDVQFEFGDVNGDKRQDMIRFGEQGTEVALATVSGFRAFKLWSNDFGYSKGWRETRHVRRVGDVNGDGRADIVGFGEDGVYVATSTGTSFTFQGKWLNDLSYTNGAWRITEHERRVADVNGDNKADLIAFGNFGVYVALSTGTSFNIKTLWNGAFSPNWGWDKTRHVRHVADVNGDKKADIVGFGEEGIWVALSNGSSFGNAGMWLASFAINTGWSVYKHDRQLGDVNGDGKADIVGFGDNAVYVSLSTGTSFAAPTAPQPEFDYEAGWRVADTYSPFGFNALFGDYAPSHPRFVTDWTGNGRADIIGLGNVNKPFKEVALAVATTFGFSEKQIIKVARE